jgi:hypothetical protein
MPLGTLIIDGQISRNAIPNDVLDAPALCPFPHATFVGVILNTVKKFNEQHGTTCKL